MTSSPGKILLLSHSGIGNLLMQSPVCAALKEGLPQTEITIWIEPRGTKAIAQNDSNIDHVIEAPAQRSLIEHIRQADMLHHGKYDIGIVLYPGHHLKGAGYLFAAGIPRRIRHYYHLGLSKHSSFLLTDPVEEEQGLHDIKQNLNLLKPLNLNYNSQPAIYNLNIPAIKQAEAHKIIRRNVPSINRPLVAIHAGSASNYPWKRWELDKFVSVAQQLINQRNAHILILGGPDETDLKDQLFKQIKGKLLTAHHSLPTIISTDLITTAAIMQRCQLVLSNDSGLMHLAAASGAPTLGLFGPTDEKKIGPQGKQSYTLRAPGTKAVYDVDTNFNLGHRTHPTLAQLTPDLVLDKISRILEQSSPPSTSR